MTSHKDEHIARSVADIEREIATWLSTEADVKSNLRSQAIAESWSVQLLAERLRQAMLTPDTLADKLGLSEHALRDRLAQHGAKFSVGDMIHHGRLELAKRLLTDRRASTSIIDVAQACGWDDPRRFAVVFKAMWGVTPKEFQAAITNGKFPDAKFTNSNALLAGQLLQDEQS